MSNRAVALPMDSAPKNNTLVCLLVDYTDGDHPLEDTQQAWTIGFNNFEDSEIDEWQFAGWSWSQDCFCEGRGRVIGWAPFDQPSRLYDATQPMADGGDTPMTASEEVLAWLLIEKIGVPDDVGYTPDQAQDIIVARLNDIAEQSASVLVPSEPTSEMLERGAAVTCSLTVHGARAVYQAMIAEAASNSSGGDHG
jgi:hypothetical protein